MVYIFIYDYLMEQSTNGLLLSVNIWYHFFYRMENVRLTDENLSHTYFNSWKPTAASAIALYLAVYFRLARLTAIRSGENCLYSLICQPVTYAMSCCWLEYLLDYCWNYFLSNILSQLVCPGSSGPIVSLLVTKTWASADYTASSL